MGTTNSPLQPQAQQGVGWGSQGGDISPQSYKSPGFPAGFLVKSCSLGLCLTAMVFLRIHDT